MTRRWASHQIRRIQTQYARVARDDWAAVSTGVKREFRTQFRTFWSGVKVPTPVVLWSIGYKQRGYRECLAVVEEHREEKLGAISPESVEAEGFASYADFRLNWVQHRTRKGFRPELTVSVFRVRPWTPDEDREMADLLLERLYGDHR